MGQCDTAIDKLTTHVAGILQQLKRHREKAITPAATREDVLNDIRAMKGAAAIIEQGIQACTAEASRQHSKLRKYIEQKAVKHSRSGGPFSILVALQCTLSVILLQPQAEQSLLCVEHMP